MAPKTAAPPPRLIQALRGVDVTVQNALDVLGRIGARFVYQAHVTVAKIESEQEQTTGANFAPVARMSVAGATSARFFVKNTGAQPLEARVSANIDNQVFPDDDAAADITTVAAGKGAHIVAPVECHVAVLEVRHTGAGATKFRAASGLVV